MWGASIMTITLYNVPEDNRHMTKTLGAGISFTGSPRGEINMVSPTITVNATITGTYNYAYIDTYGCYYWVGDITIERAGLSVISPLQRDPLTSFAAGVRACPALAQRTAAQGKNTLFIPDKMIKLNQYTFDETIAGADIFGYNGSFILITTG